MFINEIPDTCTMCFVLHSELLYYDYVDYLLHLPTLTTSGAISLVDVTYVVKHSRVNIIIIPFILIIHTHVHYHQYQGLVDRLVTKIPGIALLKHMVVVPPGYQGKLQRKRVGNRLTLTIWVWQLCTYQCQYHWEAFLRTLKK